MMTDLQVKYWTLKEAERANRAKESLTGQQISNERQVQLAQIEKALAEIDKIKADTKLSAAQRAKSIADIVTNAFNAITTPITKVIGSAGASEKGASGILALL